MNILVIEDEAMDAKLAQVVLDFEGHSVTSVSAAEQAMAAIEQNKPHLIVLDLALPGMSGLTFARQLQQDSKTSNIAIIAVTAYSHRWSRHEVLKAGCEAYYVKPIGTRQLCAHVADIAKRFE